MTDQKFVSYAQHGEDVILWRALGPRTDVTYVDVGAFHPRYDSVTRAGYERGWRGVNIEAQADRLAAFREDRPQDVNLAVAIGAEDGTGELALPGNPGWATLLRTFDDAAATEHVEVPVRRLSTILMELGIGHVDVLKVDTEGSEPDVIRGLLDGDVLPVVCVVEGVAPVVGMTAGDEAVAILVAAGYIHCMFDGLNHYLTTDPDLVAALSLPASPVDDFRRDEVERLLEDRAALLSTITALVTERDAARVAAAVAPATTRTRAAPVTASVQGDSSIDDSVEEITVDPEAVGLSADEVARAVLTPRDATKGPVAVAPAAEPAAPAAEPAVRARRRRSTFRALLTDADAVKARASSRARPTSLAAALRGELTTAEAVAVLYQEILGRPADPHGSRAWAERLERGEAVLALAMDMATSKEAVKRSDVETESVKLQLATWQAASWARATGLSAWRPVGELAASTYRDQIFVHALIEAATGRPPNEDEILHEVRKLASGAGRLWMVRAFAQRPDVATRLSGHRSGLRALVHRLRDRERSVSLLERLVEAGEARQLDALARALATIQPPGASTKSMEAN